jgi:YbbR domain-containing protein
MARRRATVGVIISCLFLAVLMWGYVSLTRMYEDYVDVPFTVTAPANQALLSTIPQRLTFRVRGTGWQILNLRLVPQIACAIDLAAMQPSQQSVYTLDKSELLRGIRSTQTFQMLDVSPDKLVLTTGDLVQRSVPVALRHAITCRPGFMVIGEPRVEPQLVDVRGSGPVVRTITQWPTQRWMQNDLHYGITATVMMSDSLSSILNVAPRSVRVHTNVQQIAERVITDVPVEIIAAPGSRSYAIMPSIISVIVRGGVDDLASISAQNIRAVVTDAGASGTGLAQPTITVPPHMTVLGTIPTVVRYVERTAGRSTERISSELSP